MQARTTQNGVVDGVVDGVAAVPLVGGHQIALHEDLLPGLGMAIAGRQIAWPEGVWMGEA